MADISPTGGGTVRANQHPFMVQNAYNPRLGKPSVTGTASLPHIRNVALVALLMVGLLGCSSADDDSAGELRSQELEVENQALQASVDALSAENAELKREIAALRERLDDLDTALEELGKIDSKAMSNFPDKEQWSDEKDKRSGEGTILERTVRLVEDSGGDVHYIDHAGRGDHTVLVTPQKFVDGETPLIVSLHGFGGTSADQTVYIPLHERVDTDGFALLLPNGMVNSERYQFWNPTDECCEGGKSGEDDVAYLTELVAEVGKLYEFDPIYFFGYSNGGFMAHHMACKGLPGLRAVASLAGTSYVDDSICDGAPPVSVLHIHGTEDSVIRFDGDATEPDPKSGGKTAFYAGAQDMLMRWSRRADCDWPTDSQPYATLDLDQYVPGAETQAFRTECAEGINLELWKGIDSGHSPGYSETFINALLEWLLSQE